MMKFIPVRWMPALLILLTACGSNQAREYVSDAQTLNLEMIRGAVPAIRNGDVILRSGRDFTSYRIRELSENDKTYSHAGIAFVTDSGVFVYHITPPDLDEEKGDTLMRLESLERFARPDKNSGFGITRFPVSEEEAFTGLRYLDSIKKTGVAFDHLFDLRTADRIYCSEMIDNTFRYATNGRISLLRKNFDEYKARRVAKYLRASVKLVMTRQYIPIDNIHNYPGSKTIFEYTFIK
ncbi:MAG: hypothetical protein H7Y27_01430 [Gemmatimonadaceae bacterium]|nr:hypothetical protein [Chitinophagaceae bacterium]